MGEHLRRRRPRALLALAATIGAALIVAAPLGAKPTAYTVVPLVSDQPGVAAHTDPNLVNAWGLTSGPTTPWWVSDNGMDLSTLYRADGSPQALVVGVASAPTGAVFNSTAGFGLPTGGKALFIFSTEDGGILGWNGAQGTTAFLKKDRSDVGAVYKGLAIADTPAGPRLYATDFHNDRVDVYDSSFDLVPDSGFVDPSIPSGFAPFGIQTIGARVFVTYAKQDADAHDDVAGQGLGFVDVYDTSGNLLGRVAQRGQLNSPWGLALAPASFGTYAGDLLVGNFGDGNINAFEELPNGQFVHRGELRDPSGKSLKIDGLWALQFAQGGNNGTPGQLFFTAGPDGESHGLFGQIQVG
ncbi:MAG TPA: TIGR03118 family protein [Gaiellaceae bacterium]|nr:TIGR03118 family protein [Gaiellaceae bacterium]